MKIHKTTKECTAYNTNNALAIAQGVLEAWEPDDRMLASEEKDRQNELRAQAQKAKAHAIFKQLDPNAKIGDDYVFRATCLGVELRIEETFSGRSFYSTRSGWKLTFDRSYAKRQTRIGYNGRRVTVPSPFDFGKTLTTFKTLEPLTEKVVANVRKKLAEAKANSEAIATEQSEEQQASARYKMWIADAKRKALVGRICGTSYVSDYGEKYFAVMPDGQLYYNGETFTAEQWEKICLLREAHALEMKNLKEELRNKQTATAA